MSPHVAQRGFVEGAAHNHLQSRVVNRKGCVKVACEHSLTKCKFQG